MAETGKKYDYTKARKMKHEQEEEQTLLSNRKDRHESDVASKSDLEEMHHSTNAQPVDSSQPDIDSIYEWDAPQEKGKRTNKQTLTKNGQPQNSKSLLQGESNGKMEQKEYQVDIWYLIFLTFTLGLSSMQFNLALAGTCQVAPALRYQQNWGNDRGRIDFYITVLSTASIFGISAGSLFGGDYVQSLGPKKTIIIFNIFGLIGSVMALQLSFKLMCLGRFFFGLTSGVLLCATSRILEDTIPVRLFDKGFGTSTNILMQVFSLTLLLMAIGMPDNRDELETTRWWRCIYGLQIPFQVLVVLMHIFVFKEETIKFCIQLGDKEQALRAISMIHSKEDAETQEQIYEQQAANYHQELRESQGRHDSVWRTLTDPNLRASTWMAIWVAVSNILSGICLVNGFVILIFDKLNNFNQSHGKINRYTSKQDSYLVGFANIIGAIASYYTIKTFSRRAIFIGGHFTMGCILIVSGYFVYMNQPELVLLSFCSFVAVYQSTQGSCLFIYVAEIVVNEVAMGLALFSLMLAMTVQSMLSTYMINYKYGLDVILYILGTFQLVPALYFYAYMRETQGLTMQQKKKLYVLNDGDEKLEKSETESKASQKQYSETKKSA